MMKSGLTTDSTQIERLDRAQLADRFRGALLGVAIGDALGAPLEGGPGRSLDALTGWSEQPPHELRYTDDTHMTLATARSLLECGDLDVEHLARTLAEHYAAEPWRGYAEGPPSIFERVRQGEDWHELAKELFGRTGSFGNGAAMRSAPLGLLHPGAPQLACQKARIASSITHTHPIGEDGAVLQACAVSFLVAGGQDAALDETRLFSALREQLRTRRFGEVLDDVRHLERDASGERVVELLGNGVEAHRSVGTALYALLRHRESFSDAVLYAISLGGDADTLGSMTGALAGALHGASAIPEAWRRSVEQAEELTQLADELLEIAVTR
jgi:poly(ADP-ribose) glycohydrolase ARH3